MITLALNTAEKLVLLATIKALAGEGILWAKATSLGRYGRTTLVKLLHNPRELCRELAEDLVVGEVAEGVCGDLGEEG